MGDVQPNYFLANLLKINSFKNDRNLHLYIDVIMIQSTVNKIGMTSINYWLLLLLLLSRFSGV